VSVALVESSLRTCKPLSGGRGPLQALTGGAGRVVRPFVERELEVDGRAYAAIDREEGQRPVARSACDASRANRPA